MKVKPFDSKKKKKRKKKDDEFYFPYVDETALINPKVIHDHKF